MPKSQLSSFLELCLEEGLLDRPTAARVHRFAMSAGCGVVDAVRDLGLMSRGEFVERVLSALSAQRAYYPLLLQTYPESGRTFENFFCFSQNTQTLQIARELAAGKCRCCSVGPVVLQAPHGMGKTHLLCAIVKDAQLSNPLYVHTADLEAELQRACRLGCGAELRQKLFDADLLAVDDVHLATRMETVQYELALLLDRAVRAEIPVVVSTAHDPAALTDLKDELAARIQSGLLCHLSIGEAEERKKLLAQLDDGANLPPAVSAYLAENIFDSVRRIKAAVTQLRSMTAGDLTTATVEMARAVVPLPADLDHRAAAATVQAPLADTQDTGGVMSDEEVARFKKMVASAENEEEQALALQIALTQRLRFLKEHNGDAKKIHRFEQALEHLREGRTEQAMRCIAD